MMPCKVGIEKTSKKPQESMRNERAQELEDLLGLYGQTSIPLNSRHCVIQNHFSVYICSIYSTHGKQLGGGISRNVYKPHIVVFLYKTGSLEPDWVFHLRNVPKFHQLHGKKNQIIVVISIASYSQSRLRTEVVTSIRQQIFTNPV